MKRVDCYRFFIILKMSDKTTYYQRNRKKKLNRAKENHEYNKDNIRDQVGNKYRELSNKEKDIKREYGRNRYHNVSEEDKQRQREYQKIILKQTNQYKYFIGYIHESNVF